MTGAPWATHIPLSSPVAVNTAHLVVNRIDGDRMRPRVRGGGLVLASIGINDTEDWGCAAGQRDAAPAGQKVLVVTGIVPDVILALRPFRSWTTFPVTLVNDHRSRGRDKAVVGVGLIVVAKQNFPIWSDRHSLRPVQRSCGIGKVFWIFIEAGLISKTTPALPFMPSPLPPGC
jgi:hypothetical protein